MKKLASGVLLLCFFCTALASDSSAPWLGESLHGAACQGPSAGNFGPYDYLVHKDKLPLVERRHFTLQVEQLVRGETTQNAMGDVRYTLVRFPNHHRALYSAVRFSLSSSDEAMRRRYPAECFLQRAIHFSPRDPVPLMLYGLYLHRLGKLDQSLQKYQLAEELAPNDTNLLYNLGLVHFDRKNYDVSHRYAVKAYSQGIALPGLKRKLEQAGYWK